MHSLDRRLVWAYSLTRRHSTEKVSASSGNKKKSVWRSFCNVARSQYDSWYWTNSCLIQTTLRNGWLQSIISRKRAFKHLDSFEIIKIEFESFDIKSTESAKKNWFMNFQQTTFYQLVLMTASLQDVNTGKVLRHTLRSYVHHALSSTNRMMCSFNGLKMAFRMNRHMLYHYQQLKQN